MADQCRGGLTIRSFRQCPRIPHKKLSPGVHEDGEQCIPALLVMRNQSREMWALGCGRFNEADIAAAGRDMCGKLSHNPTPC